MSFLSLSHLEKVFGANRVVKDFNAADLSDKPFGWNLPNWLLRREMLARMAELPNVRFLAGVATASVLTRASEALVTLSDGSRHAAHLLIGADGRGSLVRQALGIEGANHAVAVEIFPHAVADAARGGRFRGIAWLAADRPVLDQQRGIGDDLPRTRPHQSAECQ